MTRTATQDTWLTEQLGRTTWRVSDPCAFPLDPTSLADRGMAYAKLPVDDLSTARALMAAGFSIADTAVTLEVPRSTLEAMAVKGDYSVRPASPVDAAETAAIAGRCFTYSRFHADPRIEDDTANAIKAAWAMNFFRGTRGDAMLVADDPSLGVSGFCQILEDVPGGARTIDLMGVAPEAQRRGYGRALVHATATSAPSEVGLIRVGTQLANRPSLELYQAMGFRLVAAAYVLHRHWGRG